MSEYSELDRTLSRYLDGSVTADELALLESQLAADAQFAEHVARWCLAHRQVSELLTENKLHRLMDQFVTTSPGLPKETVKQLRESSAAVARERNSRAPHARLRTLGWASLAGAVVFSAMWIFADHFQPESKRTAARQAEAVPDPSAPKVVATLTQVDGAVWAAGATALSHGQLLRVGDQVALKSGMAKVTFDCGAEVVLQGPCDFWMHAPMVGYLGSGRITANVPRRAFSFAILSPQVDMVDLGTSFGVEVGDQGRTELHVFEGEVLCSEPDKQQLGKRNEVIHVTANNAMEFRAADGEPSDIAMNQAQFSRLIALRRAADVKAGHLTEDKLRCGWRPTSP
jgi:anti-sigma factor RsiW